MKILEVRWPLLAQAAALAAPGLAEAQAVQPAPATVAANRQVQQSLSFDDRQDFDFAERGYLGTRKDPLIRAADGRVVVNLDAYAFLKGAAPATVNPSLWRQASLSAKHGLFKVTDRIYQVRGFDLANLTFVKGDTGWIVIDTGTSVEIAKAAYELVSEKLGKRPVSAIIFTHSHGDHFGGGAGLMPFAVPDVPVLAPDGFYEAAVSENVLAGPAMGRRVAYHLGAALPVGPEGQVNNGIGAGISQGTPSLLKPTEELGVGAAPRTIDGVRLVFQVTPDTEAPAEMNIGFPDWEVIDLAENANPTQHNILTPRGAQIRNAKAWADGLTASMAIFPGSEILITSHGWPRFGTAPVQDFLEKHRDGYKFLHDQTVRLMNQGMTGDEIASVLKLPDALAKQWYNRPYYGSLSFNARAVYQFYMGFFDGNPVHLQPIAPVDAGMRYVAAMGGAAKVRALAQAAYDKGDYAWAAELLNRVVFADAADAAARTLLAACYDQLAWQSENSVWRNFYLSGAKELRGGVRPASGGAFNGLLAGLPTRDIFDVLATWLDPAKAGDARLHVVLVFSDRNETVDLVIANGVLVHRDARSAGPIDATLTVKRADFLAALAGATPLIQKLQSGEATLDGDPSAFAQLAGFFDKPDPNFAIVTP